MLPPVDHVLTFKAAQQSDAPVSLEAAVEAVAQLDIEERRTTHGWGHRAGGGVFGELAQARSRVDLAHRDRRLLTCAP